MVFVTDSFDVWIGFNLTDIHHIKTSKWKYCYEVVEDSKKSFKRVEKRSKSVICVMIVPTLTDELSLQRSATQEADVRLNRKDETEKQQQQQHQQRQKESVARAKSGDTVPPDPR